MNFHQTAEHAGFLKSIGWTVEEKKCGSVLVRAYIRRLPILPISLMKLQRVDPVTIDWNWVHDLQRTYHVCETVVELDGFSLEPPAIEPTMLHQGFRPGHDYMLTTKTRVINLGQSESILLAQMKPKTRYNIKLAQKHRLVPYVWTAREVVKQPDLFGVYYALLKQNARRIGMLLLPKDWIYKQLVAFGSQGFVIGIRQTNSPDLLAASLFFTSTTTCSYSHNGSTTLGRKLMAPSLIIWEGMKEGKRRGLVEFDFDGVYDERYPKRQQRFKGFGRFKAGFGGEERYFAPMYKQFRWPFE